MLGYLCAFRSKAAQVFDVPMIPGLDDGMRRPDVLPLLALTVGLGLTVSFWAV